MKNKLFYCYALAFIFILFCCYIYFINKINITLKLKSEYNSILNTYNYKYENVKNLDKNKIEIINYTKQNEAYNFKILEINNLPKFISILENNLLINNLSKEKIFLNDVIDINLNEYSFYKNFYEYKIYLNFFGEYQNTLLFLKFLYDSDIKINNLNISPYLSNNKNSLKSEINISIFIIKGGKDIKSNLDFNSKIVNNPFNYNN